MQQDYEEPHKNLKQVNSIRKTTIQTLQPIIFKLQEHVAYLLAETDKMRSQNHLLIQTIGNHKIMNEHMYEQSDRISKIENTLDQRKSEFQQYQMENKQELQNINLNIQKIEMNLKNKQTKINDLYTRNTDQSNRIDKVKQDFQILISSCAEKVQTCNSQTSRLQYELNNFNDNISTKFNSLKDDFINRSEKYNETDEKITLYMTQRQQLRKLITKTLERVEKTVSMERYDYDWRVIKVQNQQLKRDVRKQIDSALTPDVRKFLPQIMERMTQLRKVDGLQLAFFQEQKKTNQMKEEHESFMKQLDETSKKIKGQLDEFIENQMEKNESIFSSLIDNIQKSAAEAHNNIQSLESKTGNDVTELKEMIKQKEDQLKTDISSLLQNSRTQIYQIVVEETPQTEKQFLQKMRDFLPLLQSTKKEIMERCDSITQFGRQLQERLDNFNNRIVKIRGDIFNQMELIRKKNKYIQGYIDEVKINFTTLGSLVSIFCELFMINFSLGFDITSKSQIFVTYNDGLIYEFNKEEDDNVIYRKTKANKQTIKKSALANIIKLIDEIICENEYSFLKCSKSKPSSFFKLIKDGLIFAYKTKDNQNTKQKSGGKNLKQPKRQTASRQKNKLPALDQSKTIDTSNIASLDNQKQYMSQTLNSDLKLGMNKKTQKPYKGRYSQTGQIK